MFPVAILAGGLATRLRPITETIPKALVDVAGKPFIVRQLSYLREQGITQVVLCIGYLGDMVREVVGSGESFGLEVSYSEDGPNLLGTGGALAKAVPLLGNEFFVLYGDSFLPVNFSVTQRTYKDSQCQVCVCLVFLSKLILYNQRSWNHSLIYRISFNSDCIMSKEDTLADYYSSFFIIIFSILFNYCNSPDIFVLF